MASDYGLNFGFRRSDETMAIREGRLKVPATGVFRQGECVVFDPANPGFLKRAAAGEPAVPGYSGMLIQEEVWDRSIYQTSVLDSFSLDTVLNNRLATVWSGAGTKVWFKNTLAQTRVDGRVIPAGGLLTDPTTLAIGNYLGWDGTGYAEVADATTAHFIVTLANGVDYAEAVRLK
jgi:hypothetical protein